MNTVRKITPAITLTCVIVLPPLALAQTDAVERGTTVFKNGKTVCVGKVIRGSVVFVPIRGKRYAENRIANCAFNDKMAKIIFSGRNVSHGTTPEIGQGCPENSVCQITVALDRKTGYVTKIYDVLPCADTYLVHEGTDHEELHCQYE